MVEANLMSGSARHPLLTLPAWRNRWNWIYKPHNNKYDRPKSFYAKVDGAENGPI